MGCAAGFDRRQNGFQASFPFRDRFAHLVDVEMSIVHRCDGANLAAQLQSPKQMVEQPLDDVGWDTQRCEFGRESAPQVAQLPGRDGAPRVELLFELGPVIDWRPALPGGE